MRRNLEVNLVDEFVWAPARDIRVGSVTFRQGDDHLVEVTESEDDGQVVIIRYIRREPKRDDDFAERPDFWKGGASDGGNEGAPTAAWEGTAEGGSNDE